jgi:16S rRNA (cytosine1402-N4)-methyltransferase
MNDQTDTSPSDNTPPDVNSDTAGHLPVLPREVLEYLSPAPGKVILDCTTGRAGHASLILPRLSPGGWYIGLDTDPGNARYALDTLRALKVPDAKVNVVHANFAQAKEALAAVDAPKVNGLLADLGFASNQMSDPARGLSFMADGPLDMRLDTTSGITAADVVNRTSETELANLIYNYGEERLSRRIARKIVEARIKSPIQTTSELAKLCRQAYGHQAHDRIDPATRTFMALRIQVNQELAALEELLKDLPSLLAPGGIAAIISFHSLEDRIVKHAFQALCQEGKATRLTRKPVVPAGDEVQSNARSRSAKLRAIQMVVPGQGRADLDSDTEV